MCKPTILIVDDDAMVRQTSRMMLERKGCRVLEAECGETACEIFASSHVDMVILDLTMPGMSGEETLQALRELNAAIKVVIASGYKTDIVTPAGEKPDGYLRKPFRMENLYTLLDNQLNR